MFVPLATTTPLPIYHPPRAKRGSGTNVDPEITRVRTLSRVLDKYMVDPLVGLVLPGAGDLLGSVVGLYTVVIAVRRKLSPVVIARMLMNLALDALFGIVPFIGDLFDLGFKANQRNVELLTDRAQTGGKATAKDWLTIVGAALLFGAAIGLAIYAMVAITRAIF